MIDALLSILGLYLFFLFGHVLYVAIMAVKRIEASLHPVARWNYRLLVLPGGLVWDMGMNLIVCIAFRRLPRDWLLTGTLKRALIGENNWRGDVAAWMCDHLLNQFSKGRHC